MMCLLKIPLNDGDNYSPIMFVSVKNNGSLWAISNNNQQYKRIE